MRFLFLLTALWFTQPVSAQTDTLFYKIDEDEDPADFENAIYEMFVFKEKPGDILWRRELYSSADGRQYCGGSCRDNKGMIREADYVYYFEGKPVKAGRYENNKKQGEWLYWTTEGKPSARYYFTDDHLTGLNIGWYENGNVSDSSDLSAAGDGKGLGLYESGNLKYTGDFKAGLKTGQWEYYYDQPGKTKSMEVIFEKDSVIFNTCYSESGVLLKKCIYEKEARFPGKTDAWRNYLASKMMKSDYQQYLNRAGSYMTIVKFAVTKEGKLTDIAIDQSSGIEEIDNIAKNIVIDSPKWEPAIQYNQPIKAYRRQPITFMMMD